MVAVTLAWVWSMMSGAPHKSFMHRDAVRSLGRISKVKMCVDGAATTALCFMLE